MMFDGTFGSLDIHQLAAVVSCLVPVERSQVGAALCTLRQLRGARAVLPTLLHPLPTAILAIQSAAPFPPPSLSFTTPRNRTKSS